MTAEGWHHDFRASVIRHESTVFRSNTKGIRKVNNDLAVPLLELLRNILVSRKWDSNEDNLT